MALTRSLMALVYERRHPTGNEWRLHRSHSFAAQNERFRARRERAERAMGQARLAADLLDARSQLRDRRADAFTQRVAVAAREIGGAQRAARRFTAEAGIRAQAAILEWDAHASITEARSRAVLMPNSVQSAAGAPHRRIPSVTAVAKSKPARQLPSEWPELYKPRAGHQGNVLEFAFQDEEQTPEPASRKLWRLRPASTVAASVRIHRPSGVAQDDRGRRFCERALVAVPMVASTGGGARGLATGRHACRPPSMSHHQQRRCEATSGRSEWRDRAAIRKRALRGLAWLEQVEGGAIALSLR